MSTGKFHWEQWLEVASLSDIGLRRLNNQDALAVVPANSLQEWQQRGHLFVVADGMGAHAAGELASKLATDLVPLTYRKRVDIPPQEAIAEAVADANRQIHTRGQGSEEFRGMGTTICALALFPDHALVAHVGDSRVYRLRNDRLEQLTFDHSLVWELRAASQSAGKDLPGFIPRNVITRSLGPNPQVEVDVEGPFTILPGDLFLLCTDGLSGLVDDEEIGKVLAALPEQEAIRVLVDLANLRGGTDNITVIAIRVKRTPEQGSAVPREPRREASDDTSTMWRRILVLVCVMAAIAFAIMRYTVLAVFAVAVGVVGALAGALRRWTRRGWGSTLSPSGKGPYSRCDCRPDLAFATTLAQAADQLRQVALKENWQPEGTPFQNSILEAEAAVSRRDYRSAIGYYGQAISWLFRQLRARHSRKNGARNSGPPLAD